MAAPNNIKPCPTRIFFIVISSTSMKRGCSTSSEGEILKCLALKLKLFLLCPHEPYIASKHKLQDAVDDRF